MVHHTSIRTFWTTDGHGRFAFELIQEMIILTYLYILKAKNVGLAAAFVTNF